MFRVLGVYNFDLTYTKIGVYQPLTYLPVQDLIFDQAKVGFCQAARNPDFTPNC